MDRLARTRAILFGTGGVGSWCAEALVRSGLGHLTLVDPDVVCITNVNRQLQATCSNVGQAKVIELQRRLREIAPEAGVEAIQRTYNEQTRDSFAIPSFDYVIDAIDSLSCKVDLLCTASGYGRTVFSAMGAACKLDPTRIRVASIWQTHGCPLAREVRKRLRQRESHIDFLCVYSEEVLRNHEPDPPGMPSGDNVCPVQPGENDAAAGPEETGRQARVNGSVVHMTGTFGFALAGLLIQDIVRRTEGSVNPE